MLPFLHPPTFLNRLRASTTNATPPSGSSSPPPEMPHSPLLLLGMLALTARHIPLLVSHYAPAISTPTAVAEFYASALKYRLKGDDEDSLLIPSVDKIQALLMLSIHEWGQMRKPDAYMWLGLAIRMSSALGLAWIDAGSTEACSPDTEIEQPSKRRKTDHGSPAKPTSAATVEREINRRTFWAVFILDRAFSAGRTFPSGISSTDADRVQLPCEERGFMFGSNLKTGFLNSDALLHARSQVDQLEMGAGERIVAHLVKAMELWAQIQIITTIPDSQPMSATSNYYKFSTALDTFIDSLPHQLEFSPATLQVHFSTRSSSAYAVLHITLFLSRIALENQFLPPYPFRSTRPLGPDDCVQQRPTPEEARFYETSAERLYASARDMITLVSCLEEWNAVVESPFLVKALEIACRTGLYAYNFPWMDRRGYLTGVCQIPDTLALGSGEETRKGLEFVTKLKLRWACAEQVIVTLSHMQAQWAAQKEEFSRSEPHDCSALLKRISRITPNIHERNRLFGFLILPTPKLEPANSAMIHDHVSSSSEVDALLLAATTGTEPDRVGFSSDVPRDRWMAVNTTSQQSHAQGQGSDEGGSLDTLAGFAAQQGKLGNGSDYDLRDMEDDIKKEADRHWIEETGNGERKGTTTATTWASVGASAVEA